MATRRRYRLSLPRMQYCARSLGDRRRLTPYYAPRLKTSTQVLLASDAYRGVSEKKTQACVIASESMASRGGARGASDLRIDVV